MLVFNLTKLLMDSSIKSLASLGISRTERVFKLLRRLSAMLVGERENIILLAYLYAYAMGYSFFRRNYVLS